MIAKNKPLDESLLKKLEKQTSNFDIIYMLIFAPFCFIIGYFLYDLFSLHPLKGGGIGFVLISLAYLAYNYTTYWKYGVVVSVSDMGRANYFKGKDAIFSLAFITLVIGYFLYLCIQLIFA